MSENSLSGLNVRDLLTAGLHFGHQTKRWNPKMKRYIFDKRNGIHIIDITQSIGLLEDALAFVQKTVQSGKKLLFVGTKKQAQEVVKAAAEDCGMHFVTTRWLGGMLTNAQTIRKSVKRMRQIEVMGKNNNGVLSIHKKEAASLRRELDKLQRNLSGVAEMNDAPGALFVVDVMRETNAVSEANRLGIPVVAIVDTNCDPDSINYVVPGNDDSIRAIKLITDAVAKVAKEAHAEFARAAAEEHRKRETERAAERASQDARREAPRPERGDRPERGADKGATERTEAAKVKLAESRRSAAKAAAAAVAARAAAATPAAAEAAPSEAPAVVPEAPTMAPEAPAEPAAAPATEA